VTGRSGQPGGGPVTGAAAVGAPAVVAPAVEAGLRSLKLTGMADMLGERLAQARSGNLGHAELLAMLIGDEQTRRDTAGLARRLAAAHFEQVCAIEDYDFGFNPQIPAGTIRDLAGLGFLSAGQSVILHGPVGVGKTMIAQALGQLACRRGHTAVFTKTSRLLADLSGGHADRTWATRLRRWARPALLVCDDFAMRDLTMAQADDLYELITERAGRSIIITSNRAPADWYPLFPNPVVAESILDRLVNTAFHVPMAGRSYRPQQRPGDGTPTSTATSTAGEAAR
jgi:DNA replication protein DnaC